MLFLLNSYSHDTQIAAAAVPCAYDCAPLQKLELSWNVPVSQIIGTFFSYSSDYLDYESVITLISRAEQHAAYYVIEANELFYKFYISITCLLFKAQTFCNHFFRCCQNHLFVILQKIYQQVNNLRL